MLQSLPALSKITPPEVTFERNKGCLESLFLPDSAVYFWDNKFLEATHVPNFPLKGSIDRQEMNSCGTFKTIFASH